MESIDLDMDDLFGAENDIDDDGEFPQPPPMPELEEGGQENGEEGEGEDGELSTSVLDKLKNIKGAAKKVIKRPQPKLDPTRLTGERGIPIVPKIFKDVKFKGRGHEKEDLKRMMGILEHWGHRLFPKMPFDEVIERIERLGSKKQVQTCVNKIRLDMPLLDEDYITAEQDKSDDENNQNKDNVDVDDEDLFDEIMREEEERRQTQKQSQAVNTSTLNTTFDPIIPSTPTNEKATHVTSTPGPSSNLSQGLTPEQLERIEKNKQIALQKRAARMGLQSPSGGRYQLVTPVKLATLLSGESKQPATTSSQNSENSPSQPTSQPLTSHSQTVTDETEIRGSTETANKEKHVAMETDDMATEDELLDVLDSDNKNKEPTQNEAKDVKTIDNDDTAAVTMETSEATIEQNELEDVNAGLDTKEMQDS